MIGNWCLVLTAEQQTVLLLLLPEGKQDTKADSSAQHSLLTHRSMMQMWLTDSGCISYLTIGGASGKESACQYTRHVTLGQQDPLEKEMAPHSSILAWRIPWTEKPGGLWSAGSQSQTGLK